MGNRFDAYLAGRIATEPTLGTTQDGQPWAKFRVAVEDRARNDATGEWEKAQTIFHDLVVFGRLAERTVGNLHTGDPVIAQGEFRFRAYEDASGTTRTGTSFVASRLGPDIMLADVTVTRRQAREPETARPLQVAREAAPTAQPSPGPGYADSGLLPRPTVGGGATRTSAPAPTL
jgi:single-strand DNA-binding protein